MPTTNTTYKKIVKPLANPTPDELRAPTPEESKAYDEQIRYLEKLFLALNQALDKSNEPNAQKAFAELAKSYKAIKKVDPYHATCKKFEEFVGSKNLKKLESRGRVMKAIVTSFKAVMIMLGLGTMAKEITSKKQAVVKNLVKQTKGSGQSIDL